MKIGFVRVFVSDFSRAFQYYTTTLGMELDYTDGSNWAQYNSGNDVSLAIEVCDPARLEAGSKLVGRFVGVTLMVDDIAKTYRDLSDRNVDFTGIPEKQAWGGTLAHLKDPDGNILTLMEETK